MPNLYARQTALPDLNGRIDYISNPKRQEHLMAFYDGAASKLHGEYWKILARESQEAFEQFGQKTRIIKDKKTGEEIEKQLKAVQGREIHGQLPNSLIRRMRPEEMAEILSSSFEAKFNRPCAVAIHYNKSLTNLHFHLVYGERESLNAQDIKIAQRNLFFDECGKRHYKKSEITDEEGNLRPGCTIIKKGEVYGQRCFGSVNQQFSYRKWLKSAKTYWLLPLLNGKLKGDVEISEYDPSTGKLPQEHIGKGTARNVAFEIEEHNKLVKEYNAHVDAGRVHPDIAQRIVGALRSRSPSSEKNLMLRKIVEAIQNIWIEFLHEKKEEKLSLDTQIKIAQFQARQNQYRYNNFIYMKPDLELQERLDRIFETDFANQIRQERREYWEWWRENNRNGYNKSKGR